MTNFDFCNKIKSIANDVVYASIDGGVNNITICVLCVFVFMRIGN